MSVAIRVATSRDAPAIQAIYAPIVAHTPISFEVDVPDVAEMARRMSATMERFPYLVAQRNGRVAGYAYAAAYKPRAAYATSVETTVYVAEPARGQGVGRALYDALLAALSGQGFHRAIAGITLPNDASVALHEAVGFAMVGVYTEVGHKLGRYHDVGFWQRPL